MAKLKRAFTLLEVMVALGIFAMGILALIGNLPWALSSARITEMQTIATMLAERQIESIKSDPDYENLEITYNDSSSTRRDIPQYTTYKAALNVVSVPNTANELKKITVIIFWYQNNKKENSFTLVNLRKRG